MKPKNGSPIRIVRTQRGARIEQDDAVLSKILVTPGPTNEWWDVLAATVDAASQCTSFLMLGFAGGGIVAPLRAMGYLGPIEAIDLSSEGETLFRELSSAWAGEVRVHQTEAQAWLRETTKTWDVIMEDLSVSTSRGVLKPEVSFEDLPALIASRLGPSGSAIFNLLSHPRITWKAQLERVTGPFSEALTIRDDEYENRIVVASHSLPAAGILAGHIRARLEHIASERAANLRVRAIKRTSA